MSVWEDIKESLQVIIMLVVAFIVVASVSYGLAYIVGVPTCYAQTKDIGYAHRYDFFGGCQVNINGRWIPLDNFRSTDINNP